MEEGLPPKDKRLAWLQDAYKEVLDANKHLDDKIGRFVTSMSFLTVAGLAFAANPSISGVRYCIGEWVRVTVRCTGWKVALPEVLLGAFGLAILGSLLLFLFGLGPILTYPGESIGPTRRKQSSHIFFAAIARQTTAQWEALWASETALRTDVANTYMREAHYLAWATYSKYKRLAEGRVVLSFALVALVSGFILGIYGAWSHTELGIAPSGSVPWTFRPRLLLATVVGLFAAALPYEYLRLQAENPDRERGRLGPRLNLQAVLLIASPLVVVGTILPFEGVSKVVGFAIAGAALLLVAQSLTKAWPQDNARGIRSATQGAAALFALAILLALARAPSLLQIAMAFLYVGTLEPVVLVLDRRLRDGSESTAATSNDGLPAPD